VRFYTCILLYDTSKKEVFIMYAAAVVVVVAADMQDR
jgi:hypothetical protein